MHIAFFVHKSYPVFVYKSEGGDTYLLGVGLIIINMFPNSVL